MRHNACLALKWFCWTLTPTGAFGCAAHTPWLATWEAPPQLTEPRNLPPAPGLAGSTLRQWIHVSVGGERWRVRLSNEFGDGPLTVTAAHLARTVRADTIDVSTGSALLFNGRPSVTIAAGSAVLSDPVRIAVPSLGELTVSVQVGAMPAAVTGHPGSRTTSYLVTGNHVAERSLAGATRVEHWYILSGVEVVASPAHAAVIVLGNSIADGRGSGTDRNNRWPDNLARRLQADSRTAHVAVLNAGIGGNTVLRGGLGPTALSRLDRDVLAQAGARWLIVSEGVNDIGGAHGTEGSATTARELIDAYREIIRRAKARGLRVYGATILPFGGSNYASPDHESARATVNRWIRESGQFDAVIDLDAAMRDPADPTKLRAEVDGGDHLHPNELGYRMMADAIDLGLFVSPSR
jgi:lysophospholipase L1-like esterase